MKPRPPQKWYPIGNVVRVNIWDGSTNEIASWGKSARSAWGFYQQDRKAHIKSEAYALVYMKIEMGARKSWNTDSEQLVSSLKSKIISFLLILKDFNILVEAFFGGGFKTSTQNFEIS